LKDHNDDGVDDITLSYTFYPAANRKTATSAVARLGSGG
jgi:cytochrome c oxidase assembly protein Cox11